MGLLRRARAGRVLGATGSVLLAVAATLALLPAPALASLTATLTATVTGRAAPAEPVAGPHLQPVAGVHWESSKPWTGNQPWAGPVGPAGPAGASAEVPAAGTTRVAGPTGPKPPTPPTDPVPPGPLEPPHRLRWIGGPTPPQCPWPRTDIPAPADWYCEMERIPDCPQYSGPQVHVLIDAVPGTGSATISWWNYGDPDVVSYRVAPIEYTQRGSPSPTWETFQLPVGCYQASHTITGLTPGARYEFMLEAVETNHAGRGTALHRGIGLSSLITIG
jgi:hypothetical protein